MAAEVEVEVRARTIKRFSSKGDGIQEGKMSATINSRQEPFSILQC